MFAKAKSSFLLQDVDSLNINSSDKASQLLFQKKYDSLLLFCGAELSKLLEVRCNGVAIGTYARDIIEDFVSHNNFYTYISIIKKAYKKAKQLVDLNINE